jgi:hypothetical protein
VKANQIYSATLDEEGKPS